MNGPSLKVISLVIAATMSTGIAKADEKLLEAALKRIEALEGKVSRLSGIEAENKNLRSQLESIKGNITKQKTKAIATVPDTNTLVTNSTTRMVPVAADYQNIPQEKVWQGVYAGINAGYSQSTTNLYSKSFGYTAYGNAAASTAIASASQIYDSMTGPLAGAQIGYNYQFANNIIFGGEIDMDWADINDSSYYGSRGSQFNMTAKGVGGITNSFRNGVDWLGTARFRAGYALGNFMPYLTGGFAYGGLSVASNYSTIATADGFTGTTTMANYQTVQTGWALGAGAEYMVAAGWSARLEYLYTQLGGINGSGNTNSLAYVPGLSDLNYITSQSDRYSTGIFSIHQARIGLNYHTNWLASSFPIAAKY